MFISPAYAQSGSGGPDFGFLFLMIGIFVIFYFFLIRPNQKKEKERRNMQTSLKYSERILKIEYRIKKRPDMYPVLSNIFFFNAKKLIKIKRTMPSKIDS